MIAVMLTSVGWLLIVYPRRPSAGTSAEVRVDMDEHQDLDVLSNRLSEMGAIDNPLLWRAYMRLVGAGGRLRSGEVILHGAMTPAQVARRVADGMGPIYVQVTIPEGFNRVQTAARLQERGVCQGAEFLALTEDPEILRHHGIEGDSFEGYLFPDTYELMLGTPPRRVLTRLINTWRRRVMPLFDEHAAALGRYREELGWGSREVITLASIVEEETGHSIERPLVAGVFLNRLRSETFRPRRLQADPTVAYGCLRGHPLAVSCDSFDGERITRSMLQDSTNPYNTYRHDGLPPGPISSPGLAAIRAVLHPGGHAFLYFVARGGGRHAFSETLQEHQAAVRRYREGR